MEHTLQRWIQRSIIDRRADAEWIRTVLVGHRFDLHGMVSKVSGDTITDKEQFWPTNLYGRFTGDGHVDAGDMMVMVDGDGAGQSWEILNASGSTLQVMGGADLEAADVRVDNTYRVDRAFDARAISFIGQSAIRCVVGYPGDPAALPCYSVLPEAAQETSRPIGDHARNIGGPEGPLARQLKSDWRETYSVVCQAITPEGTLALSRMLRGLYLGSLGWFSDLFRSDRRASMGELGRVEGLWERPVFMQTFSISGVVDHFAMEDTAWLIPDEVKATVNPTTIRFP